jgi:hypothetical protein
MVGALTHAFSHVFFDAISTSSLVEEGDVLLPTEPNHHSQSMIVCDIEKPSRWDGICANRVGTHARNASEVGRYGLWIVVKTTVGGWAERSVRDATNEEFFFAGKNEFAADFGAYKAMRRRLAD